LSSEDLLVIGNYFCLSSQKMRKDNPLLK